MSRGGASPPLYSGIQQFASAARRISASTSFGNSASSTSGYVSSVVASVAAATASTSAGAVGAAASTMDRWRRSASASSTWWLPMSAALTTATTRFLSASASISEPAPACETTSPAAAISPGLHQVSIIHKVKRVLCFLGLPALERSYGLDWTGLDSSRLDWTGLAWIPRMERPHMSGVRRNHERRSPGASASSTHAGGAPRPTWMRSDV
mmetsp:Transcript_24969/g.99163  ORF Transcript_24969/g.99163 Transcript_24969/m.99163 type:complete len:210 (-) Transcript_24969:121-750(-)